MELIITVFLSVSFRICDAFPWERRDTNRLCISNWRLKKIALSTQINSLVAGVCTHYWILYSTKLGAETVVLELTSGNFETYIHLDVIRWIWRPYAINCGYIIEYHIYLSRNWNLDLGFKKQLIKIDTQENNVGFNAVHVFKVMRYTCRMSWQLPIWIRHLYTTEY